MPWRCVPSLGKLQPQCALWISHGTWHLVCWHWQQGEVLCLGHLWGRRFNLKILQEALSLLEPMTNDPVNYVRQGALIASALILIQQTEATCPKVKDFRQLYHKVNTLLLCWQKWCSIHSHAFEGFVQCIIAPLQWQLQQLFMLTFTTAIHVWLQLNMWENMPFWNTWCCCRDGAIFRNF